MRHTAQFNSPATIPHVVRRGLQLWVRCVPSMTSVVHVFQSATSEPKGPVYLWARREVMEEEIEESFLEKINTSMIKSPSIEPSALSPDGERFKLRQRVRTNLITSRFLSHPQNRICSLNRSESSHNYLPTRTKHSRNSIPPNVIHTPRYTYHFNSSSDLQLSIFSSIQFGHHLSESGNTYNPPCISRCHPRYWLRSTLDSRQSSTFPISTSVYHRWWGPTLRNCWLFQFSCGDDL